MTFTIRPAASGGWLAFISGPRLLLVAPQDDAFVAAAWSAISAGTGFQDALDLLTSKGLAATPEFVLIERSADARIIVRGSAALTVTDADGEQQVSAAGVSTWVERTVPGVTAIALAVPGAAAAESSALPVESGVALVASIASDGALLPEAAPALTIVEKPGPVVVETPAAVAPVAVEKPAPVETPAAVEKPVLAEKPIAETPEVDIEATRREAPEAAADEIGTPPPAAEPDGYDYLFGDTMFRGVADAAVREPEPDAEGEPETSAPVVDDVLHDGETVMTADIAKLRGKRRPRATEAPRPDAAQKLVLVLPSGAREPLVQSVLIGRSPSVSKLSGGQIPRMLTLGTADQDISRNHAQFALEGGTVVVTDLHSRNGTSIVLPGKSPQKLRAGEPTAVIVGTVVDLGGGVTITVDEEA